MSRAIDRLLKFANFYFAFFFIFSLGFVSFNSPLSAYARSGVASNGGIYWPQNQVLPVFAQPHALDVVDLQHASPDEAVMFSTLEGIINRQEPRIYLLRANTDEGPLTWLNDMKIPYVVHANPWEVVTKYIREVKGVIVYDPLVMDSLNVAVTQAGLQDGLVVSPDLAAKLEAAPYHLQMLSDLRGKFSSALEAYTWEFQNLWPQMTHRMLIGIPADTDATISPEQQQQPIDMPLVDYAVANRAMVFWLRTADMQETALFTQILSSVQPGTPYLGWFDNELNGVTLTSMHAVEVFATDYFENLTVFSGVHAQIAQPRNIPALPLQNKIYVTFTVSDGDNLQYDEHHMRQLWDNTGRGSVPLNWSIDPVLSNAAPFILRYYQQTATMNDLLIAAPSGNGYYYPSLWPASNLGSYLSQSEAYLQRAGMNIVFALDVTSSLLPNVVQEYNRQMQLDGMFYYNDGGDNSTHTVIAAAGTAPVSSQVIIGSQSAGLQEIQQLAATWDAKSPLFISVLLNAWLMTPADAAAISQALGANYSVVRADQYLQLFREAQGLPSGG